MLGVVLGFGICVMFVAVPVKFPGVGFAFRALVCFI